MRRDSFEIIKYAISAVMPNKSVEKALKKIKLNNGKTYVVSIGKAAWQMARSAEIVLRDKINDGIVITKYGHVENQLRYIKCYEAGHPVPDYQTFYATEQVINMVSTLNENDNVIFLISGGGSSLFELPLVDSEELIDITNQLLACGANINEINTIRKHLSKVKGGRFAKICSPANIFSIVLSDIIEDPLDMIASGPAYPDSTTSNMALDIIKKYNLIISESVLKAIENETPKSLSNVITFVTGSVSELCRAVEYKCRQLGYETIILSDCIQCEAKEFGSMLASITKYYSKIKNNNIAIIAGGETVVNITGKGNGGRNQEIALSSAQHIEGLKNVTIFSFGSDGTDGPTDAAGGIVDGNTSTILKKDNISIYETLKNNNSYYALNKCDGLIKLGPTGTNVNDVSVALIKFD